MGVIHGGEYSAVQRTGRRTARTLTPIAENAGRGDGGTGEAMTSTAGADLRVARLTECLVLTGPVAGILGSPVLLDSRVPLAVVLHPTPAPRHSADGPLDPSLLLAGTRPQVARVDRAPGVAVIAPLARVTSTLLAPSTELLETPLVRASRALVTSIASDVRAGGAVVSPALDDVLMRLVRGIVDEHPRATAAQARDTTLDDRVSALIEARHTDPRLDVSQLARELHTSRRQLYRHVGEGGVATLLSQRRVATARELLVARPDLTVSDIATRSGFTTTSRLRAQFLRWAGQSPTEYRRSAARRDDER